MFKFTSLPALSPLFSSLGVSAENRTKSSLICPLCFREANGKTRAAVVTILSRERSAVRFDDAARNRQPHSGPFRFCRKEWLEKLLDYSAGKSRTRIPHADADLSISIATRPMTRRRAFSADDRHCFKCIHRQIEQAPATVALDLPRHSQRSNQFP